MVTWDELQKREDEDAVLIKTMLSWLMDFNEYEPVDSKDVFGSCRDSALTGR